MASLAPAPPITEIPLELFGGTDSELDPSDLPEGLSPDNQDVGFLPGSVFVRPGVKGVFTAPITDPFGAPVSILYEKSYVQPDGTTLNLVLGSDGFLYFEDVTNNPRVPNFIARVTQGTYAQSVSAFGREYIAFSDLLHGQSVPLQFDGTNLDRVTQDGPGAPPSAIDENVSYPIDTSPTGLKAYSVNIKTSPDGLSQSGHVVTVNTTGLLWFLSGVQVGDSFVLAGATNSDYDGTWRVSAIISSGVSGSTFQFIHTSTGLTASGGGTATLFIAKVFTTPDNFFATGQLVEIAGATNSAWNGIYTVRRPRNSLAPLSIVSVAALPADSGDGTIASAGSISIGTHKFVVMFLTRQGYITKPSPVGAWTSAGSLRVVLANLPIGPANVVARIIAFTGAGGGDFFTILENSNLPGTTPVYATVIRDNTTDTVTLDFSDNALFGSVPIDVVGNDLFDQFVLGNPMGFFAFASRLMTWGDWNKVENFINMGFDGGSLTDSITNPLGWNIVSAGGQLVPGGAWNDGAFWGITGSSLSSDNGEISQSAYQDENGNAILQPNTRYMLRCWLKLFSLSFPAIPITAKFHAEISSITAGFSTKAEFLVLAISQTTGSFVQIEFDADTPNVIPPDMIIRIFGIQVPTGIQLQIDELEIIFAANPYKDTISQVSYAVNPEAFALTTCKLGAEDDQSPIRCFSLQRNSAILKTAEGVHEFTDNTGEPDTWDVNPITRAVGAMSLRSGDPGKFGSGDAAEDWDVVADEKGLYLFAGGDHWKVSQEYQTWWDRINLAAEQTVVIKNDPRLRRIYCAVPIDDATTPNLIFIVDYRELDTAVQIAGAAPLHITLAGLMKSSDLTRKWTRWNLAMNSLEILIRPGNKKELCLGGNFGNIYTLDQSKQTDDDYGQKFPYYDTYGFPSHDQEQQFQLGAGRKDFRTMQMCVTGHGLFSFIPLVNSLNNPLPQSSFRQLVADTNQANALANDLEWTTTFSGNRTFFRVQVDPLPGETDVDFNLKKMVVGLSKGSTAYRRSSWL